MLWMYGTTGQNGAVKLRSGQATGVYYSFILKIILTEFSAFEATIKEGEERTNCDRLYHTWNIWFGFVRLCHDTSLRRY